MIDIKQIAEQLLRDIEGDREIYPAFLDGMANGVRKLHERIVAAAEQLNSDAPHHSQPDLRGASSERIVEAAEAAASGSLPGGETPDGEQQAPPGDQASGASDPGTGG